MNPRAIRKIAIITIGLCLGYTATVLTRLPWWTLFFVAAVWIGVGLKLRWGHPANARYRKMWPWSLLPLSLWGVYVYLADSFGIVDLGAVFFIFKQAWPSTVAPVR